MPVVVKKEASSSMPKSAAKKNKWIKRPIISISHLKIKHDISHKEAKKLCGQLRNVKANTVQQYTSIPCPVESCPKYICWEDKHLMTHSFTKNSAAFIKYNSMAKGYRAGHKTPQETQPQQADGSPSSK